MPQSVPMQCSLVRVSRPRVTRRWQRAYWRMCRGGSVPVEAKICGLTRSVDAELADAAGAAYLGVIFAGGPRERSAEDAKAILSGRRARKVGVFAGRTDEEIASIAAQVGLDVIQLHAESTPERIASLRAA